MLTRLGGEDAQAADASHPGGQPPNPDRGAPRAPSASRATRCATDRAGVRLHPHCGSRPFTRAHTRPPSLPLVHGVVARLAEMARNVDPDDAADRFDEAWRVAARLPFGHPISADTREENSLGAVNKAITRSVASSGSGPRSYDASPGPQSKSSQTKSDMSQWDLILAHLSSSHLTDRIGGLLSLGEMVRMGGPDAETAVTLICAYVRGKLKSGAASRSDELSRELPDVHKALTLLSGMARPLQARLDLSYIDLRGVDLRGAIFSRADLAHANLSKAQLAGARLNDCTLRHADFSGADLQSIDLRGADLTSANLANSLLIGAKLDHACLASANFTGADLRAASLADSFGEVAHWPEQFDVERAKRIRSADIDTTKFAPLDFDGFGSDGAIGNDEYFRVRGQGDGCTALVFVEGELDMLNTPILERCLRRTISAGHLEIYLDVAGLTFVSSAGMSVILSVWSDLQAEGGTLYLRNPNRLVWRAWVGLDGLFYFVYE